jgi:renalase
MTSCIVVGAGISALTAARELSAAGRRVVVLDEGHRAGGRMATRGIGNGIFDLGAQFFTTRSERFEKRASREASVSRNSPWTGWRQASSRNGLAASPRRKELR